ncbi:heat shock 70 kDa protein-like [Anoplophora glabripennis]|uniref:heat shock 70 kDa protein-like n=1 Tax=Anoplophora glabripennis TaxID=217634 RepID=UPI000874C8A9|nr:heat shock 70 kDa protein-like [Anoplophora glabripennis]
MYLGKYSTNKMSNAPAIGIDLGTTFSCVSVYRNERAELIANTEGDRLTPSIVYFDPKNGEVYVGRIADESSPNCPSNCLLDAKRFIGRQYDDDFVLKYIKSKQKCFSLVPAPDGQVAFEIEISNKKIIKKPEEVSAEVLKYLKKTACNYLGENVTKAVISVPAYFSNAQRKATKQAAELAGLSILKLVTEPTAAAIHYVSDKHRINSNILVFDFGGGTLDVSLIKVTNNVFEVKSVYGDTLLGGRDFDNILFTHFYKKICKNDRETFKTDRFKRKLQNICANLKKNLSVKEEFTCLMDKYDGNSDVHISMTRTKFEKLCNSTFRRITKVLKLSLEDSGLSESDISEIVLVGGSTRIPKIKDILASCFGPNKIKTDLNPDEAVAAGASIQAALLLRDHVELEKYKVTEVTPMSLGIEVFGNRMCFLIPRNSPLPSGKVQEIITCSNHQNSIVFCIYEGERKNISYNNKLGEFTVMGLPKKRAGDVKLSVDFYLDEDGILDVRATEMSTGKSNRLVVTMDQFRLSDRKIKFSLEDAKKHKIEDDVFEEFMIYKGEVREHCLHVLYDVKKISSKIDRNFVKESCERFLTNLELVDFTEIEKLEAMFAVYNNSISGILQRNLMLELTD